MNYKKMTFRASMLGLIVMLFAGLVSCSSDDDDKNIPVEETKVPTTGAIVFLYAATEDELSICDMIAEYTDENGATKTEAITATKWKKQINFSSLPAKGLISIKRTLKANVELEKKSYQFSSHSLLINGWLPGFQLLKSPTTLMAVACGAQTRNTTPVSPARCSMCAPK